MRRITGGVCLAFTAAFLALVPGAAAAQTVVPSSVGKSATLRAGSTESLRLACPKTAVALSAASVETPTGVVVSGSRPGADPGRWTLRFASASGAGERRVRAVLRCVKLRLAAGLDGATLRVSTESRAGILLAPGQTTSAELDCPDGYAPTGQGVGSSSGAVALAAAVPRTHGWTFRLENGGTSSARASVHIRCLQRGVEARRNGARVRLRFDVARATFEPTTTGSFSGACARSRYSLATGITLDPADDIRLRSSYPVGRWGGLWLFDQASGAEPVKTYLLCLSRKSSFR